MAVEVDPGQDTHDRYGRTLAASSSQTVVTTLLRPFVRVMRAYVYGRRPSRWASEIMAAERQAKSARIGTAAGWDSDERVADRFGVCNELPAPQ